jgi:hypothetical protein
LSGDSSKRFALAPREALDLAQKAGVRRFASMVGTGYAGGLPSTRKNLVDDRWLAFALDQQWPGERRERRAASSASGYTSTSGSAVP